MAARETPRRQTLTPDAIARAALAIVDKEGVDALSMRRLGSELGVAAMAVYNHFPNRDAVLDLIAENVLSGAQLAATPEDLSSPSDPRKTLQALLASLAQLATDHPHAFAVAISRPTRPAAATRLMVQGLAALQGTGMSEALAISWYHTALMVLQGYPSWSRNHEAYGQGRSPPLPADATPAGSMLAAVHASPPGEQLMRSLALLLAAIPPDSRH